ncbi:hypothetical protein H7347_09105 [Corynebacterium sp. zg-331]|uniref:hypothetical protein n=1 Tax=unclassified Corynebacterium TaxID=2624378 RepID=UPI00128B3C03|nr:MULTISPECIES: hypothetical protein [unclassified Corynebacterium]MBC3186719.1 hypothetical protein [Corynebacterium sp. zg-331]MPV53201.1 hypothetical protein [Corynebacterium sp. zg331]
MHEAEKIGHTRPTRPESVRLIARVWALVLGAELVHQVLSVVMTLWDTSALKAAAKDIAQGQAAGGEIPDSLVNAAAYLGVGLSALIALGVVALLAWMLKLLSSGHRRAAVARRAIMIFAFYFAVRAAMVVTLVPGSTGVPVGFYAVDGSVQILAGVGAAVTLVFVFRRETLAWTGEIKGAE